MSQLIFVEQKPMQGKEHVPQEGAVIGREGSDINLADPEVSRRHATIHVAGEQLSIEDLGSTNGTFVNGQQVQGTRVLSDGDEVRLGNTVWRVQSPSPTVTGDAPGVAPPQVTTARQVPDSAPPPSDQAPPVPTPPAPAAPAPAAAQQPAPPAAQQPAAPRPPAPQPPAPGAGARGDVPAPDVQPSAIRRVVPPPGGPAPFQEQGPGRQKGSAATRVGATVMATIIVALTAAGVIAYYVVEPFEDDEVSVQVEE